MRLTGGQQLQAALKNLTDAVSCRGPVRHSHTYMYYCSSFFCVKLLTSGELSLVIFL